MGKSLDFVDACFAFYDEPSGGVALDWVEAGFLDMAVVCSTSFIGAAARGAKLAIVAVPFTDIESNVLVARNSHEGFVNVRHVAAHADARLVDAVLVELPGRRAGPRARGAAQRGRGLGVDSGAVQGPAVAGVVMIVRHLPAA